MTINVQYGQTCGLFYYDMYASPRAWALAVAQRSRYNLQFTFEDSTLDFKLWQLQRYRPRDVNIRPVHYIYRLQKSFYSFHPLHPMSTHPHHTSQPPHLTGSRQLLSIPACSAAPPVLTGTPAKEIAAVGFGCMWNVAQIFPHGDLLARELCHVLRFMDVEKELY